MSASLRRVCPYLGLARDASTHMGFPSEGNLCFHADPRVSPGFSHQLNYCLRPSHEGCSIYREVHTSPPQDPPNRRVPRSIFVFLILASVMGLFWLFRSGMKDLQTRTSAQPLGATVPGIPSDSIQTFAAAPQPETVVPASFTPAASETSSPLPAPSEPYMSTPYPVQATSLPGRDGPQDR